MVNKKYQRLRKQRIFILEQSNVTENTNLQKFMKEVVKETLSLLIIKPIIACRNNLRKGEPFKYDEASQKYWHEKYKIFYISWPLQTRKKAEKI